jgi:hypothetical protein
MTMTRPAPVDLNFKGVLTRAMLGFSLLLSIACSKISSFEVSEESLVSNEDGLKTPVDQLEPSPSPTPDPTPSPTPSYKLEALAWESKTKPERLEWSAYTAEVVEAEFDKLDQAQDAEVFCPSYDQLDKNKKINFWAQLFAGIAYYESGWSPVSRMQETTMGTDPVTGRPVYSEGLLQLSYQDIQWATYCEFDWNKDKHLAATDPAKTILDPFKNLRCGIKIMADQVARKKEVLLSSGVYWAVIKENGRYEKIDEIAAITKRLSFCK